MKAYKKRTEILHPPILSSEAPKMMVLCPQPQSRSTLTWSEIIGRLHFYKRKHSFPFLNIFCSQAPSILKSWLRIIGIPTIILSNTIFSCNHLEFILIPFTAVQDVRKQIVIALLWFPWTLRSQSLRVYRFSSAGLCNFTIGQSVEWGMKPP